MEIQGGSSLAGVKGCGGAGGKAAMVDVLGNALSFSLLPRLLSQAVPLPHMPAWTNCAPFGLSNAETTD